MTVAAVVRYREGPPQAGPDYVPLATEHEYLLHWLPLAKAYHLDWCQQFATGVTVGLDDVPAVVEELGVLVEAVRRGGGRLEHKMLERIEQLRRLLLELDASQVHQVFIG